MVAGPGRKGFLDKEGRFIGREADCGHYWLEGPQPDLEALLEQYADHPPSRQVLVRRPSGNPEKP